MGTHTKFYKSLSKVKEIEVKLEKIENLIEKLQMNHPPFKSALERVMMIEKELSNYNFSDLNYTSLNLEYEKANASILRYQFPQAISKKLNRLHLKFETLLVRRKNYEYDELYDCIRFKRVDIIEQVFENSEYLLREHLKYLLEHHSDKIHFPNGIEYFKQQMNEFWAKYPDGCFRFV
jgi:hypothetical protein